ncbi:MAG: peptidylprolyl isomerase [Rhizobacter sp.]|nr:peptidylprolyl isomerase [Rhizobacter sp.]
MPNPSTPIRRLLREPLLHFLVLGAALFAAAATFEPQLGKAPNPSREIRLTPDELLQLATAFQSQWRRPPTVDEFAALAEDRIRQEVLYREALALGLDKDDEIVKRRMAQKMKFIAEDVAAAHEPSSAELEAWFDKNQDKFRLPGRVSFRQLYFSPDKRGARAKDDAAQALQKLAGQPEDAAAAASLGDRMIFQDYYRDRTGEFLGKEFGPRFAIDVGRLAPNAWQGPVESGMGWHLVYVDTVVPGRVPAFAEIEPEVKTAWLGEQKASAWDKAYKDMRAKYTVLLPAPPEAEASASAPSTGPARPAETPK